MEASLRRLRAVVLACDSSTPAVLRRQLKEHQARLEAAVEAFQASVWNTDAPLLGLLAVLTSDGTVPCLVLHQLERVLCCSQPSDALSDANAPLPVPLSTAEAQAAYVLARCFTVLINVLIQHHSELASVAQALQPMLAAAQPCRILCRALQCKSAPAPIGRLRSSASFLHLQQTAAFAVSLMLSLVAMSLPCGAVLTPHLLSVPGLWAAVCDAFTHQLPATLEDVQQLSHTIILLSGIVDSNFSGWEGRAGPEAQALLATLLAAPAAGLMLLQAAAVDQSATGYSFVLLGLSVWLASGPDRPCQELHPEAQQVVDVAQAMHRARDNAVVCVSTENEILLALWRLMDGHECRQGAFSALAAHTDRALDLALGVAAAAEARAVDGATAGTLGGLVLSSVTLAAALVQDAGTWHQDGESDGGREMRGLTSRARWLTKQGVTAKCEALMRSHLRSPGMLEALPCGHDLACAMHTAALLIADERFGTDALCQSLATLTTHRKAFTRWAATVASSYREGTADFTLALLPAGAQSTVLLSVRNTDSSGVAERSPLVVASAPAAAAGAYVLPVALAATAPPSALPGSSPAPPLQDGSPCSLFLFAGAVEAFSLLPTQPLLCGGPRTGPRTAFLFTVCGALQLLPLVIKHANQRLRVQPASIMDTRCWLQLLEQLSHLHALGLGDVTASIGVPVLLRRLVRSLRPDFANTLFLLQMTLGALQAACSSLGGAWLDELARAPLLEEIATCAASMDAEVVLATLKHHGRQDLLAQAIPGPTLPRFCANVLPAAWVHAHVIRKLEDTTAEIRQRMKAMSSSLQHSKPASTPSSQTLRTSLKRCCAYTS